MRDPTRFELATDVNFDEQPYLLANPDVARAVAAGGDAWDHFDRHGRREGRLQLTPAAAGLPGSRAARKYARFRAVLDSACGEEGDFRFLGDEGAFPVAYGEASHAIEDYDAESANPGLGDFVEAVRADPDGLYLDVGCGKRGRRYDNLLYLDVYPSPSADVVMAPACLYPIASGSLDGIGCFAVLEHVTEPWVVAREFHRMLKPGGRIFIDYPFLVPVHGYPSHYYNATRDGLARLFAEGFETISLDTRDNQTPDHAIVWQIAGIAEAISDEALRQELLSLSVAELIAAGPGSPLWARILAALPEPARNHYAAGNTLIAVKR